MWTRVCCSFGRVGAAITVNGLDMIPRPITHDTLVMPSTAGCAQEATDPINNKHHYNATILIIQKQHDVAL